MIDARLEQSIRGGEYRVDVKAVADAVLARLRADDAGQGVSGVLEAAQVDDPSAGRDQLGARPRFDLA